MHYAQQDKVAADGGHQQRNEGRGTGGVERQRGPDQPGFCPTGAKPA
jgi:hypothetical protein